MTPEFAYFLKVNVAFMLFYAFYRLFFYKDTFFKLRRTILLAFFGLAIFYPLLNIQDWVRQQQPMAEMIYIYSTMLPEATAGPGAVVSTDWLGWTAKSLVFLYWGVVAALCGRFLIQLGSILWLAYTSRRETIHYIPVYSLKKPAGPFSFFRMIFLHPDSHSEKELDEILTHERTHVSQWHSIDVMIGEFICMICWFNPFIWLLKREVRHNLEYLADNTVIQSGYDSKSYQYHLLGLAHHQAAITLYNSFNVLHLKNRILMMNKKRSPGIWRTKYLFFIPLAALLMVLSNMETIARLTARLAREVTAPNGVMDVKAKLVDDSGHPLPSASVEVKGGSTGVLTDLEGNLELSAKANSTLQLSSPGKKTVEVVERKKYEQVFTVVEKMPRYPGGDEELLKYIAKNVRYPKESQEKGEQGRVICAFVVGPDGSISDPEILRGVAPLLDEEAMRVILSMPKWAPGQQRGKAVAVKYTVPITFRLQENDDKMAEAYMTVVDEMPQFPGGDAKLLQYIAKSIKYPVEAQEANEQGRVICSFVVGKDGQVKDWKIVRSVSPSLDKEALRVISSFPLWSPGKQNGKAVPVLYKVPITFRLA